MPKVTEEHRLARREQILDAAVRCVAREGFHKTSMSHVIGEAQLSAGAVYGYFKSKNEIIRAIADRVIGGIDAALHEHLDAPEAPRLDVALEQTLDRVLEIAGAHEGADLTRVAVQVWAEACRDDDVHEIVRARMHRIRDTWAEIVARGRRDGTVPPEVDPDSAAQVLFGLMPGFILQRLLLGDVAPAPYAAALRALLATPEAAMPAPSPTSTGRG